MVWPGEALASYYNVGGENTDLEIQELEIEAILEPATMGVETTARSLPVAASAAASATAPIVATGVRVANSSVPIVTFVHSLLNANLILSQMPPIIESSCVRGRD